MKRFADIQKNGMTMFNEYWDSDEHLNVSVDVFMPDLIRAVAVNVLRAAAEDMRDSGPTIAALLLEVRADEVEALPVAA